MQERGWRAMAGLPMPGGLPAEPLRAVGMSQRLFPAAAVEPQPPTA